MNGKALFIVTTTFVLVGCSSVPPAEWGDAIASDGSGDAGGDDTAIVPPDALDPKNCLANCGGPRPEGSPYQPTYSPTQPKCVVWCSGDHPCYVYDDRGKQPYPVTLTLKPSGAGCQAEFLRGDKLVTSLIDQVLDTNNCSGKVGSLAEWVYVLTGAMGPGGIPMDRHLVVAWNYPGSHGAERWECFGGWPPE